MGLTAEQCVAFEDSENGVRSAVGAGVKTVVTPNAYTRDHNFADAALVTNDLEAIDLASLEQLVA
jgi:beta-phosphoglucomutase-like phosphatase (HAD superfamily)